MRIVGNLRFPTGHSRDILLQAKGITGIESTQIRWFSRWSGGGAGPVEHSSAEAKSLKTKGQGTVRLPPQWATTEAVRREGQRPNKGLLSWQLRKIWLEAQWGKRPKKKDAYSMLQSWSCRRGWCWGWWSQWWVRTRIANHRSVWQRYGISGLSLKNEG